MIQNMTKYGAVILLLYSAGAWLFLSGSESGKEDLQALILAALLALLYMVASAYSVHRVLKKPAGEFVRSFMKNMIIRMGGLLAIFFTILLIIPLNHFVFIASFFILYFLFQIVEIYLLHNRYKQEIS